MNPRVPWRMITEVNPRLLRNFLYTFGWKGMRAVQRFERRKKKGQHFPAFMFISVTNRCNLSCQGCWVTPTQPPQDMDLETLDALVAECGRHGSHFFGILGGEPLLHKGLFDFFERHPDSYFLLFTNGSFLDDDAAAALARAGNVTPLISIEGLEEVSDVRRGGKQVYSKALAALEACRKHRLVTGVATSVCRSNQADLASGEFVRRVADMGAHYLWYYIYRPVGPQPTPELALDADEIHALRRFIVDIRQTAPLAVVDAYWDHQGKALCPAVTGIAHHVGPSGAIEVCPPIQFACDTLASGKDLAVLIEDSAFLKAFRTTMAEQTRGCILLDDPAALHDFMQAQNAQDSSGRGTAYDELAAMTPRASHHQPGKEIPERSWAYRLAKKFWFFGFGAYG
jgi:MoaA/NifB/PqqE/SkfB family radical SAM enzyme